MRKKLKKYSKYSRNTFKGRVEVIHYRRHCMCITTVKDMSNNKIVTNHVWITLKKNMFWYLINQGLQEGDIIKFTATVKKYERIHELDYTYDFGLTQIENPKILKKKSK